jgi:hypothetical protein
MQFPPELLDLISAVAGFVLTIFILSYLIGDNILFRVAIYVFVGAATGYVAAVACTEVLYPALIQPFLSGNVLENPAKAIAVGVPLLGSLFMLFKISPRTSFLGQLPMAYLAGVGAAVVIGGGVLGTLLPQINATFDGLDLISAGTSGIDTVVTFLNGALILLGVIGTLAYFHFGATQKPDGTVRRNPLVNIMAWVGRIFIAITFGVLFAGVYMAALTALIERMDSIRAFFLSLMQ